MRSSSRIIRPGSSSTATAERARAGQPEGTFDSADGGDPTRAVPVLRGNRSTGRGRADVPAAGAAGTIHTAGTTQAAGTNRAVGGSGGGPADASPIDLLQAQRIADQRGYARGHARAATELESAIATVAGLAERLEAVAPARTAAVARTIADVAIAVSRRVIGSELRHDPSLLVHAIETAVTMINGSPEARVILHPSALAPVRAAWESAHGNAHLGKRWTFEADGSLEPGACLLRFDHGFIDAGIEAQLTEIERALDAAIPGLWGGIPANGDTLIAESGR